MCPSTSKLPAFPPTDVPCSNSETRARSSLRNWYAPPTPAGPPPRMATRASAITRPRRGCRANAERMRARRRPPPQREPHEPAQEPARDEERLPHERRQHSECDRHAEGHQQRRKRRFAHREPAEADGREARDLRERPHEEPRRERHGDAEPRT